MLTPSTITEFEASMGAYDQSCNQQMRNSSARGTIVIASSVFITFAIAALPLATSPSPGHMEDGVVLIQIECGGNVTGIKKPSRWRLRATARYGFFRVLGGVHVNPASLWKSEDCSKRCPDSVSAMSACGRKCPETCRHKCNYGIGASDPASAVSGLTLTVTPLRSRVVSSGFPGTSTRRLR